MTDQNLLSYIQKSREDGMSDDFIRASLLDAGWDANMVDSALFGEISEKSKISLSDFAKEAAVFSENNSQMPFGENYSANELGNRQMFVIGISAVVIILLGAGLAIASWFFYSKPPPKTEKRGIESIAHNFIPAGLNEARAKSRDTMRIADITQLQLALELYYDANNGAYASNLNELSPKFIPTIPKDPLDNEPYRYFSCNNGLGYHLGANLEMKDNVALASDKDLSTSHASQCANSPIKGDDFISCSGANSDRFCYDVSETTESALTPQLKPSVMSPQNQPSTSITSPSSVGIKITEPKHGSVWTVGQQVKTVPIRWTYFCGVSDGIAYITLLRKSDSSFYKQLYANPHKLPCEKNNEVLAGTDITISSAEKNFADVVSGSDYFIRIESYGNSKGSNISSDSDLIAIINSSIGIQELKITRPYVNETLCLGTNYNIRWTHSGLTTVNLYIGDDFNSYGIGGYTLKADRNEEGVSGYGSFEWKIGNVKKYDYTNGSYENKIYILPESEAYWLLIVGKTNDVKMPQKEFKVMPITIQQCNG